MSATFSHRDAREVLRRAYVQTFGREPTQGEVDFGAAVALFETLYGRGAGNDQFRKWSSEGKFNWGALQSGTADTERTLERFQKAGLHPTKEVGSDARRKTFFYLFPSDLEAARAFLMIWGGAPETLAAAASGSARAVAVEMRKRGYYEGFWVPPGNPRNQPMPPFKEASSAEEAEANNIGEYAAALGSRVQAVRGPGGVPSSTPAGYDPLSGSFAASGFSPSRVASVLLFGGASYLAVRAAAPGLLAHRATPSSVKKMLRRLF